MIKGYIKLLTVSFILTLLSVLAYGCSRQAERVADGETADQMEVPGIEMAAREGREAAKAIINKNWNDTMQLQMAILEARAVNSKYEMEGNKECKEAFDTAFYHTIATVRPELAKALAGNADSE